MAAEYQSFMMEREEEMGEAWHEVGAEVCKLDCVCIVYPGACYIEGGGGASSTVFVYCTPVRVI